jgi:tRNA(Ile)-lysidine synthase
MAPRADLEQTILQVLPELLNARVVWLACSGGLDSTCLLNLFSNYIKNSNLGITLKVVHVDHKLQVDSGSWAKFCADLARAHALDFKLFEVKVPYTPDLGQSIEVWARDQRYTFFEELLNHGDLILLAQHQDDQLETIMQRILRGSGPKGLQGMPARRSIGKGNLLRPWLSLPKKSIVAYAHDQHLNWVEDMSNDDLRFERNVVRAKVLPLLRQHWQGIENRLLHFASLQGKNGKLLRELAQQDLIEARSKHSALLNISALKALSENRLHNALYHYSLEQMERENLAPAPSSVIARIRNEVLFSADDANPVLSYRSANPNFSSVQIRRYQQYLYWLPAFIQPRNNPYELPWQLDSRYPLIQELGVLKVSAQPGEDLSCFQMLVRRRVGGEYVSLPGRTRRPLKQFMQENKIPPWVREQIPLLYLGDELVAIADLYQTTSWPDSWRKKDIKIIWERSVNRCGF